MLARSVTASEEVGDPVIHGPANGLLIQTFLLGGEMESASSLAATTLERVLAAGTAYTLGWAHQTMARTGVAMGRLVVAREHVETAVEVERPVGNWLSAVLAVAQQLGSGWRQAVAELLLGRTALAAGEARQAERHVHDALAHLVAKGLPNDVQSASTC